MTLMKRINGLSANIKENLLETIGIPLYSALQLDETTYIIHTTTLLLYVRYEHKGNVSADKLLFSSLVNITAEEVFNTLNEFIRWDVEELSPRPMSQNMSEMLSL